MHLHNVVDAEGVVLLHVGVRPHLGRILDEPADQAVDPHDHRQLTRGGTGHAHRGHAIRHGLRPGVCHDGGEGAGNPSGDQEDLGGLVGPEEAGARAGGEESQEIGDGDLEVHHGGNLPVAQGVQAKTGPHAVGFVAVEGNPEHGQGGETGHATEHTGDGEEHLEVPLVRGGVGHHVVVADGDKRAVVEEGDKHEHHHGHVEESGPLLDGARGLELRRLHGEHGNEEEDQQLERGGNTVGDERCHTPKHGTSNDDGRDDGGEAGLGQHNISGGTGGVGGALHGHTHISALEGRGIVDTITSHAGLQGKRTKGEERESEWLCVKIRMRTRHKSKQSLLTDKREGRRDEEVKVHRHTL